MATAFLAQGTKLAVYDGGYQDIERIHTANGPSRDANLVESTSHDSTGGYREYIQGLKDGGEVTFSWNMQPDTTIGVYQQILRDGFDSGDVLQFRITFTDDTAEEWFFSGIVTGLSLANWNARDDSHLQEDVTIKVTGTVSTTELSH